jgi:hypothetical protein
MFQSHSRRARLLGGAALLLSAGLVTADTLVLRNGRRIEGELIGYRDGRIEFETRGFGRRIERFDREEVRSVDFEDHDRRGGYDDDRRGGGGGRPSGLRERNVTVDAASQWSDTGIELRRGQEVQFEASGKIRWGKDRHDGPGGERNSPRNPGRPIPNRPGAALIGRIDNGDPFFIGDDQAPIRVRDSGRLYLGINDDYLLDNQGSFRVIVYY